MTPVYGVFATLRTGELVAFPEERGEHATKTFVNRLAANVPIRVFAMALFLWLAWLAIARVGRAARTRLPKGNPMNRFTMLVLAAAAALAITAGAGAQNIPHPTLDAIASSVAGKPLSVWCENNDADWDHRIAAAYGQPGYTVLGFTRPGVEPVAYLAPQICTSLQIALRDGPHAAGLAPLALALLTLLHESVHQRGILDESVTDCTALALVGTYAISVRVFPTVPMLQQGFRWQRIRGKRVRVPTVELVDAPNPDVGLFVAWAAFWHSLKPSNYQGAC